MLTWRKSLPLAALLFTIGAHSGFKALEKVYGEGCFDHSYTLLYLYGPLLFLTVKGLLRPGQLTKYNTPGHLLPYPIALLLWTTGFLSPLVATLGVIISQLIYITLTYNTLNLFDDVIEQTRSSGQPQILLWLKRALYVYMACFVFMVIRSAFTYLAPDQWIDHMDMSFFIVASLFFAAVILKCLMASRTFLPVDADEEQLSQHLRQNKQRMPAALPQRIKLLENHVLSEKPFKDPQITVKQLSEQLNLPARQLSELINDHFGVSFSEFINRERVKETQRLMASKSWENRSLLDIGLAAGFNSKSSFNLMFKRYAGTTPSDYRKSLQQKSYDGGSSAVA